MQRVAKLLRRMTRDHPSRTETTPLWINGMVSSAEYWVFALDGRTRVAVADGAS